MRAAKLDHLPHRRNAMAGHGHFHDGALIDEVALHVDDQEAARCLSNAHGSSPGWGIACFLFPTLIR
ncbi:hypothetical protein X770_15340 [Mesorhizobium sp. LSJC269B00]|nr:hypothetical protein X770_15340 [Mesorhizobium sp. LSJC269B00]